jgi:ankyrin repeat protein
MAAQYLNPERVRLLLDHGARVNIQNRFGATPLFVALMKAREDDRGVVGMLLAAGADLDIKTTAGVSPRELVAQMSNWNLARFLRMPEETID